MRPAEPPTRHRRAAARVGDEARHERADVGHLRVAVGWQRAERGREAHVGLSCCRDRGRDALASVRAREVDEGRSEVGARRALGRLAHRAARAAPWREERHVEPDEREPATAGPRAERAVRVIVIKREYSNISNGARGFK